MSDNAVDTSKRTWLIASTCAGAAGGVAVAVPFVSTFQPSERAKAAGAAVEVDISALKPGEKLTVEWRGKPVWIIKRTPEQLESLKKVEPQLADPKSERKPSELTPEYARNISYGPTNNSNFNLLVIPWNDYFYCPNFTWAYFQKGASACVFY
mgnify:CR=1 FL=1